MLSNENKLNSEISCSQSVKAKMSGRYIGFKVLAR